MSTARLLVLYRSAFVALITLAGIQTLTLGAAAAHRHAVPLASAEIAGALALLWHRTELLGGTLLLVVFAAAEVLAAEHGRPWPTQFLQYGASTLLILLLGHAAQARCRADSTAASAHDEVPPPRQ